MQNSNAKNLCASAHLPKTASDAVKILFKIDHVLYPSFLQHTKHTYDTEYTVFSSLEPVL